MKKLLFYAVILLMCSAGHGVLGGNKALKQGIVNDASLVVPGVGAEKILLGSAESDVIRTYPRSEYIISRPGSSDFFKNVLDIEEGPRIVFDKILHFNEDRFAVFLLRGQVCAITGFAVSRVTSEGVALDRGADYFVFSYGNKSLKRVQQNRNVLYLYTDKGIAVADDDGDDDIDLYVVFAAVKKNSVK